MIPSHNVNPSPCSTQTALSRALRWLRYALASVVISANTNRAGSRVAFSLVVHGSIASDSSIKPCGLYPQGIGWRESRGKSESNSGSFVSQALFASCQGDIDISIVSGAGLVDGCDQAIGIAYLLTITNREITYPRGAAICYLFRLHPS